jgi:hypothetical protein
VGDAEEDQGRDEAEGDQEGGRADEAHQTHGTGKGWAGVGLDPAAVALSSTKSANHRNRASAATAAARPIAKHTLALILELSRDFHLELPGTVQYTSIRTFRSGIATEQPPRQTAFRQQQPIVPRALHQPASRFTSRCCGLVSDQFSILLGSTSRRHRFPGL